MLKPGLGKGLGELMKGDQVAGKDRSVDRREAVPAYGRGLETLVRPEPLEPVEAQEDRAKILPTWFYFAADILLLAYAIAITFNAPRPFDLGTILFCAGSISLGALLAIFGVAQSARDK